MENQGTGLSVMRQSQSCLASIGAASIPVPDGLRMDRSRPMYLLGQGIKAVSAEAVRLQRRWKFMSAPQRYIAQTT